MEIQSSPLHLLFSFAYFRRFFRQWSKDHNTMLSRLRLSATIFRAAASIIGTDPARPWVLRGDENGAFGNFLESIQKGSMHTALRQCTAGDDGSPSLFRIQLGNVDTSIARNDNSENAPVRQAIERDNSSTQTLDGQSTSDGRLIPIIFVGINPEDAGFPPIIDAAIATPPSDASDTIDTYVITGHYGIRVSRPRRASTGGLTNLQSVYYNQRAQHHDLTRPFSATSESPTGTRPPPCTPVGASLSSATTPTQTPSNTADTTSTVSFRHGSFLGSTGSGLESTSVLGSISEESETLQGTGACRRRRSESDFAKHGCGSSGRNGTAGLYEASDIQQGRWNIYVFVGIYPENHPALSVLNLFSDFLNLTQPGKPAVASEADIARAPGLFSVLQTVNCSGERSMTATELRGNTMLTIAMTDQCPVCLDEFEEDQVVRQLVKCSHLFHKECIDQMCLPVSFSSIFNYCLDANSANIFKWLTTGRNCCPLCMEEGVETSLDSSTPAEDVMDTLP